jgi:ferredoxin
MLKRIRITLAIISVVAVTMLFLDFTGFAKMYWGWLAKIQFVPALLALNFVALAIVVILTLLFGRIYCSVICPLGVYQDVINYIRNHVGPKKHRINRFKYKKQATILRMSFFVLFVALVILGLVHVLATSIAGLLDPYSLFGRIATALGIPVYDGINNLLADYAEANDSYQFYQVVHYTASSVVAVAVISLVIVTIFAWTSGRDYCNKICPVGTILGCLSKYSVFKPVIDLSKCNGCQKCARNCKSSCIDPKQHKIDYSRCVNCFDCLNNCHTQAISFSRLKRVEEKQSENIDSGRRQFMVIGGLVGGALAMKAADKTTDGGLTVLKGKKMPERATALVPPGALSHANFHSHCTACQLCVTACPERLLKPSTSLDTFMQPEMSYENGYCRPECTACSDICPVGAIRPIDVAKKSAIQIGRAVVDVETCISASQGANCGNCSRHCPTGAIEMIPINDWDEEAPRRPMINTSLCIGCGSCEYHCPVGNVETIEADRAAIHVEGNEVHHNI